MGPEARLMTMSQAPQREVLGISQVVLGVDHMGRARDYFASLGFTEKGHVACAMNPREKAQFIAGAMAASHDLTMLAPPAASPSIELVKPNRAASETNAGHRTGPPVFELVLGWPLARPEDLSIDAVIACLEGENSSPLGGLRVLPGCTAPEGVVALLVYCRYLDHVLSIWRRLGFESHPVRDGMARIDARGIFPGSGLSFIFLESARDRSRAEPDMVGAICPTFLCRDVEKLAPWLALDGHQVGERFKAAPFGTRVNVFFARTPSGELYEFLSIS